MNYAQNLQLAMLVKGRRKYIFKLAQGESFQSDQGFWKHDDLIGQPWGSDVESHLGKPFMLLEPSLRDVLLHTKRQSQIIFPKDIGYILLRLSIGPGKRVIEAGTGSGAFTTALAWSVGDIGKVFSYDRREDMQSLAQKNLVRMGLGDRVQFYLRDIETGFDQEDIDAIFLDLPGPENYLSQVRQTLTNGGELGSILPTMNQVSSLVKNLEEHGFGLIEVCEILIRFYKTTPERMRPFDRMIAHTGYLVFARHLI